MSQDPGSGAPMSERMQSLLSRAVEDQLSEQRQLAGALSDMLAQLNRLGERLDALQPSAGGDGGGALAAELRESVRLLGERVDGVARLVQERGHDLVEVRGSIDELKAAVKQHTTALGGVTSGLSALPSFGERIDALQAALGGLHDRLRGLEELTAAANGAFERAEAHDAALREMRQAFSGVAARVAQLPGRDDVEGVVGRLDDPIESLGNRLGRLESALPSVLERLDDIADTVRASGERAGATGAADGSGEPVGSPRLDAVEAALNDLHGRLGELHDQAADTSAYDGLTSRLDELHAGLFGAGGLHEQLTGMTAPGQVGGESGVEAVVAAAVADSEQRLTDHIDEAVLALAEALLRRRTRTGGRPTTSSALGPPASPAPVDAEDEDEDELDEDEVDAITEFRSDPLAADEDEDEDEEDDDDEEDEEDEDDEDEDDDDVPAASVTESAPSVPGPGSDAAPRKRKPWWRPGG